MDPLEKVLGKENENELKHGEECFLMCCGKSEERDWLPS